MLIEPGFVLTIRNVNNTRFGAAQVIAEFGRIFNEFYPRNRSPLREVLSAFAVFSISASAGLIPPRRETVSLGSEDNPEKRPKTTHRKFAEYHAEE